MKPTASSRLVRTGSPAACLLATAIASLLALHSAQATTRTKAATGTDLTLAASWGTLPVTGDVAAWTSTSLGAGLTLPSALPATGSLSISVTGALSDIDITGAGPLTLGSSGMDLSASAVNMSIGIPIALGASQTWTVNSGKTLTASGIISGSGFGITKAGAGTGKLTLSGLNTYSGKTVVNAGTLTFTTLANVGGGASALGSIAAGDTANGTIDLYNGATLQYANTSTCTSDRIINLAGTGGTATIYIANGTQQLLTLTGNVTSTASGPTTLTVGFNNNNLSFTMNGAISDSTGGATSLSVGPGGGGTSKTFTLGSTNSSYTGTTTVTRAVLKYASIKNVNGGNSSLGNPAVGNGTINVGADEAVTLNYTGSGDTTDRVINLVGTGTKSLTLNNSGSGLLKFTSDWTATGTGNKSITLQTGNFELGGAIPDSAGGGINSLNVQFVSSCTLSATNSSYSGATLVAGGGALTIKSIKNIGSNSSLGTGSNVANGTITIGSGANGGMLVYNGTGSGIGGEGTTDRIINLAGSSAGVIDQSGTGLLKFTGGVTATTGTRPLTLQGSTSGAGEISGAITNGAATSVSLTKQGTGTWTLSGTNSYTGATLVSLGTLLVNGNGTSATGAVTVASGATLGGTGIIGGKTTVNGILAPGASVGKLTFANVQGLTLGTLAAGSLKYELGANTTAGTTYDTVDTQALAIGTGVLNFTSFQFTNTGALAAGTYTLISSATAITGTLGSTLTGSIGAFSGTLSISGNNLVLTIAGGSNNYASWATTNGVSSTPSADSNNDGVQNGVAYFMNATGVTTNPGIINNTVTWPNGGNIDSAAYGTQFVVQTSIDLVTWSDVESGDLTTNTSGPSGALTYTLPASVLGGKVFTRLAITPN